MIFREVQVGQVLKPIPGGTIDTKVSERYKITRKLRGCLLALTSAGHEVIIEKVHLAMLQPVLADRREDAHV